MKILLGKNSKYFTIFADVASDINYEIIEDKVKHKVAWVESLGTLLRVQDHKNI